MYENAKVDYATNYGQKLLIFGTRRKVLQKCTSSIVHILVFIFCLDNNVNN